MIDGILIGGGRADGKTIRVDERQQDWLEPDPVTPTISMADADPSRPPRLPVTIYRKTREMRRDHGKALAVFRYWGAGEM